MKLSRRKLLKTLGLIGFGAGLGYFIPELVVARPDYHVVRKESYYRPHVLVYKEGNRTYVLDKKSRLIGIYDDDTNALVDAFSLISKISRGIILIKGNFNISETITGTYDSIRIILTPDTIIKRSKDIVILDVSVNDFIEIIGGKFDGNNTGTKDLIQLWGGGTANAFINTYVYNTGQSGSSYPVGVRLNTLDKVKLWLMSELCAAACFNAGCKLVQGFIIMKNNYWGFYDNRPENGISQYFVIAKADEGYHCVCDLANHSNISCELIGEGPGPVQISLEKDGDYIMKNINLRAYVKDSPNAAIHIYNATSGGVLENVNIEVIAENCERAVEVLGKRCYNFRIKGLARGCSNISFYLRVIDNLLLDVQAFDGGNYGVFIGFCNNVIGKVNAKNNTDYDLRIYNDAAGQLSNFILDINVDKLSLYGGGDGLTDILLNGKYSSLDIFGTVKFRKNKGVVTVTGDGTSTSFTVDIPHRLVSDKVVCKITLDREGSIDKIYLVDKDNDGFKETIRVQITFASAPASGEEVPIYWSAEVVE